MSYVLVVDDEAAIRFVYQEYLEGLGVSVRTAPDGHTGLRLAREECPKVALVDINLPDMSGVDVVRGLRELYPDLRVAVISATPRRAFSAQVTALGVQEMYEKPIDLADLDRLVRVRD